MDESSCNGVFSWEQDGQRSLEGLLETDMSFYEMLMNFNGIQNEGRNVTEQKPTKMDTDEEVDCLEIGYTPYHSSKVKKYQLNYKMK